MEAATLVREQIKPIAEPKPEAELLRELTTLELALVGGGQASVAFM